MNTSVIEHTIHSILNPEFRCKISRNPIRDNTTYAFIDFTTKKITQRIDGGKEACLLQIGERIYQLDMEKTSILIFDECNKVICNCQFKVKVFEPKESIPNFVSDLVFSFYHEKDSRKFFYSIWVKNQDKIVTGFAETSEQDYCLAHQKEKDILWICSKLTQARGLNSSQKQIANVQARVYEVDFQKGIWNIHNH